MLEDHFVFKLQDSSLQPLRGRTEKQGSSKRGITWEWRIFWPATTAPLVLDLAPFGVRDWQKFLQKDQIDIYVWERDRPRNLKIRRHKLQFKPILETHEEMIAFGPKQKFIFPLTGVQARQLYPRLGENPSLYDTVDLLLETAQNQGYTIRRHHFIKKGAKTKLLSDLVLELSVFTHENQTWRSFCLEGSCFSTLCNIRSSLQLPSGLCGGYLDFLRSQDCDTHV